MTYPAPHIAEIVTYKLIGSARPDTHRRAAAEMDGFLHKTGAVLSRVLSCDDDGLWTDHILWTSKAAAEAAQQQAMQRPEFQRFFSDIDPDSCALRHAPVQYLMDKDAQNRPPV